MKTKTVTYQRVKNLGNYESERLEMMAEVDEHENDLDVAQQLRARVTSALFLSEAQPPIPKLQESDFLEGVDF